SVVKPQVLTSSVRPSRVVGSSSTMRTRSPEVVEVISSILACRFYTVQQSSRMLASPSPATMSDSAPESLISPGHPEITPGRPAVVDVRDRVTAALEILLCSSVPTQLTIGVLLRAFGIRATDAAGRLSLTFVVTLSLSDT